ncbi:OmpW family protein [Sphingomonas sp. SORGH_AS_0879]|uniref:OmpW/AlkL family protein n=1 Tax=Sphingomonas sp. SORGH_AS_0879 TaxID=3041790 RepID=UPI0027871070|nr:OmpW family outer membrane protein [Sphingomonas sp. SORGH_AS_0879]MDQ1231561.1 outer membrane protein [Sphingomonas sp. SORGH_AS_0879]
MTAIRTAAILLALAATGISASASAEDRTDAQPRVGVRAGDVLLRARAILVAPNERSGSILPAFPGETVKVDNRIMPEVDATYMATNHLGFELIASTTKHSVSGVRGTTGSIGKLASTWVLPPTLTAQYHFMPTRHVRPYVGAGVNYTIFWNESASDGLQAAVGPTKVHLKDSIGWAAQAGVDMDITRRVFLNLDIKYIDIDTTARLDNAALGRQRVNVSLDPLVFGIGLGVRL